MVKITKGMARKLYNEGAEIMVVPDRVRPNGVLAAWTSKPEAEEGDFDKLCNAVFYYSCSPETGMKLAFYAKEVK